MRIAYFFFFLSLFCIVNYVHSQTKVNVIDSLENELTKNQILRALAPKKNHFKIDTTRVNILNILSSALIYKADFKKAELITIEALALAQKLNFKRGEVNSYNLLGELYQKKSEYRLALQNLDKAIKIGREIDYKEAVAIAFSSIGLVNNNLSNYPEALKNHLEALKIREALKDKKGLARSYSNLGNISSKIGNYDDALKYHIAAFKLRNELNDRKGLLGSYNNIGTIYNHAGNYKKALENYQEALKIGMEYGDISGLAIVNLNIGDTYCALKEYDKALDCNFKALKFQKTIKNDFGITRCYIYLACIYKALHELQLSRVYLDSAIKFSKALGAKQLIRDSYELLSEVDSLANNWENAYNHYKIYVQYKDSIINKDNSEKMLQSQFQYELEKKNLAHQKLMALKAIEFEYQHKQALAKTEKEKQKLKYEQQIKEQKLSFEYSKLISKSEAEKKHQLAFNKAMANEIMLMNQNSYNEAIIRWLLLIALLAFVALGLNYYKNYKKQKAANNIIAKQGEDLKALIHELNHRVKNNFQTVASMLRMQSRTKDDQTLVNILMQTSNQFLSIANAHQKLYLQESLGGIPVKDYLFDIVDTISPQYGITKEQFEFKITVACDLKININTMVPLVLIANELVTNSIKHAFNFNKILNISIDILHIQENKYQFIFRDNGPGFPQNVSQLNSFGLKLLKLLAEQLHGKIEFSNNNGAVVILDFEFE